MNSLRKVNVARAAAELTQPFSMLHLGYVGDILVSVYVCQGTLEWHKHLDHDEMFWVHQGMIVLESEWGEVQLRPGEIAVVPKGISHRSGARQRAHVLLFHCGLAPERKNGQRRIYALAGEARLKRVNLYTTARTITMPFEFHAVGRLDDSVVEVAWGEGVWDVESPAPRSTFYFALSGGVTVSAAGGQVQLQPGEFVIVPREMAYHLNTAQGTALVRLDPKGLSKPLGSE